MLFFGIDQVLEGLFYFKRSWLISKAIDRARVLVCEENILRGLVEVFIWAVQPFDRNTSSFLFEPRLLCLRPSTDPLFLLICGL